MNEYTVSSVTMLPSTCEVFVLIVTVVEKTLGAGEAGHALDALLHDVGGVAAGARPVVALQQGNNQ